MDLKSLLFSFQGRINRQSYWLASLGTVIVEIVLIAIAKTALSGGLSTVVVALAWAIALWICVSLTVKRAHDLDRGLAFAGLAYLPSIASFAHKGLVAYAPSLHAIDLLVLLFGTVIGFMPALKVAFFRGTAGANQFGSNPLRA
jgi:uncharacterized membrane protein YhaH (DUF805 family)